MPVHSTKMTFISNFHRFTFNLKQKFNHGLILSTQNIHTTPILGQREVIEKTDGNVTTVEGRVITSERNNYMLNVPAKGKACVLCRLNMNIKYTDVMIVSQFVQEDGNIVPRQVSGLCFPQHARMKKLVHQAHRAGLMQHLRPHVFPEEYSQMSDYAWKKYNVYFSESLEED